ncbi:MAG: hypothetical protein ACLP36_12820 [Acidimicrobiales bacterium]
MNPELAVVVVVPDSGGVWTIGVCARAGLGTMTTRATPRAIIAATCKVAAANFRDSFTFSQPFKLPPGRYGQLSAMGGARG